MDMSARGGLALSDTTAIWPPGTWKKTAKHVAAFDPSVQ